jgi:hypothetical protein
METSFIRELSELDVLDISELKQKWLALTGTKPPAGNRTYLVRRLAWAIQNTRFGGNPDVVRARLQGALEAAGCNSETGIRQPDSDPGRPRHPDRPAIGTRWTRFYNGEWHELTFVTNGVSYRGVLYSSPTALVHAITGTHRSGPAWFLNAGAREKRSGGKNAR